MKQKKLAFLGIAAVAGLALASCGDDSSAKTTTTTTTNNTVVDTGGLDIALNYTGKQGITLREDSFLNTAEARTYSKGDLLPTWQAFSTAVNTTFREASAYTASKDDDYHATISTNGYKSETDTSQYIDLYYNTTSNINKMGSSGDAKDLMQYVNAGIMPNFKKFLEENPTIKKQISDSSGHIYYTPYFDGYNAIERMNIMDTSLAEAVLDAASTADFDTTKNGKGAASNVVQASSYTPFIDSNYNYPNATTTLSVSVNGEAKTVTIAQTTNIIKQQNELLANGCTGKELADQLRTYLTTVMGNNLGTNKTWTKLSDFYISESAAYNVDELVALMRVVKANPGVISGDPTTEIETFTPRGVDNNRVQNVMHLLSMFGVQGQDAEKEGLFFDANGKINDAFALESTFEALNYISALYDEGLILGDFFTNDGGSTDYLNKYFGKTAKDGGYGFMMYDFSASTGAVNTKDEFGIGTADSSRAGSFKDTSVTGVRPVLPPVTWWATETTWSHSQALSNHTGMTLTRRSTSNRTLKTNSWCIPSTSDNPTKAAELMDYLFSTDGQLQNDFGPKNENYWKSTTNLGTYNGTSTPEFSDKLKTMISNSSTDFWSFMRAYLGSTHGIGYVRTASINYQATNANAKVGQLNIENAIADGVVCLDKVDKHGSTTFTYDNSVPSAGYGSESSPNDYAAVTAFWGADKCAATASGWAKVVVDKAGTYTKTSTATIGKDKNAKDYSYSDVFSQLENRINKYLFDLVSGYDESLLPEYALS